MISLDNMLLSFEFQLNTEEKKEEEKNPTLYWPLSTQAIKVLAMTKSFFFIIIHIDLI